MEIIWLDLEYVYRCVVPVLYSLINVLLHSKLPHVLRLHRPQQLMPILLIRERCLQWHGLPHPVLLVNYRLGALHLLVLYHTARRPSVLLEESVIVLQHVEWT